MAGGQEREIPRDITSIRPTPSEPKPLPVQRGENTQRASLPQQEDRSNEPSHEDMVAALRRSMEQKRANMERGGYKYNLDPVEYLGRQLSWQGVTKGGLEYPESAPRSPITNKPEFPKLLMAWDAISHPYLKSEFDRRRIAGVIKSFVPYFEPTITFRPNTALLEFSSAEFLESIGCDPPQHRLVA